MAGSRLTVQRLRKKASFRMFKKLEASLKNLDPLDAAAELQRIVSVGKGKESPELYLLLGDRLQKAGDEAAALEAFRKARELDPKNMPAVSQLLCSLRRLDQKEEAWPLLKLLLYHHPGDQTAKALLLKDAVELGKENETALFFEELLKKYPQRKELYAAIRKLKQAAPPTSQ